ncbi:helix-turn-helix domain-containing protein [Marinihelvus fidelis]|uniref:Helix-turn-helix domain-containing protein n=1 Tax=Marinihelvus fidelis TaxID=2613842 RepID=A0A5N0THQ9_9GAMM|nr:helix-turn-helix domain-containing protein [Marinihelvus fidelis]KAA9134131.1 helix-turn-helix domain-containing protein [Marinihelvus fidelis]
MKSTSTGPEAVMAIADLEQARLLADPLKLSILQAMGGEAKTTMQVAEAMGEKPTRLYRHVEALEAAGLVRLVRTRPKRGTVEKYYQAVARRFEVHPDLFAPEDNTLDTMLAGILTRATTEIGEAMRNFRQSPHPDGPQPLFLHLRAEVSAADLDDLHRRLMDWADDLESRQATASHESTANWSGFLAFYPSPTGQKSNRENTS